MAIEEGAITVPVCVYWKVLTAELLELGAIFLIG
jgi:hypothetical protein